MEEIIVDLSDEVNGLLVFNIVEEENRVLPPIQLIDFELFADRSSFSRFHDHQDICTTLDEIDRDNTLVIFISHNWLLGDDGYTRPDNVTNEKFKLTVAAIRKIKETYAPGNMTEVYVWLDFGCMDQDGNPASDLIKQLDEIVRNCDLIFTLNFDKDPDAWSYPEKSWLNIYEE